VDQSKFLVNTSLAMGKSLQSMQNIIEKLKKNIEKLRGEISKEDKIMAKLKNQNNELIEKLAKQKT